MRFHLTILSIVLTTVTLTANAAPEYVCKHYNSVRKISVVYEQAPSKVPCKVNYDKEGSITTPWTAVNQEGYCEEKAMVLRKTLSDAGWQCDGATADASTSTSTEQPAVEQPKETPTTTPSGQ